MRALETRFVLEVLERHRPFRERDIHSDRVVLGVVVLAMRKCGVRSQRSAHDDLTARRDLQRAAVIDAEGQLDNRAGLTEEDGGIDAGESGLAEFGNRRLLSVAGLDLRLQPRQLCRCGLRIRRATDELKRPSLLAHKSESII